MKQLIIIRLDNIIHEIHNANKNDKFILILHPTKIKMRRFSSHFYIYEW